MLFPGAHKMLLAIVAVFTINYVEAQSPTFFHINTGLGLSDNYIRSVAVDSSGYLWIGTLDGLNVFDGYQVTSFQKEQEPAIPNDNIIHLTCDANNNIWMGTTTGIAYVDARRKFHRVILNDSIANFGSRTILNTKKYGPVIYTSLGQFFLNKNKEWERLDWMPDALRYEKFFDAEHFSEDQVIFSTNTHTVVLDYAKKQMIFQRPDTAVVSVCKYNKTQIAIAYREGRVRIVDINNGNIVKQFQLSRVINGKIVHAILNEIRGAVNGDLLLTTDRDGLAIIRSNDSVVFFTHDPINFNSISSNLTRRVLCGPNGDIIVGSSVAGISTFNIKGRNADYKTIFSDGKGDYYDSYISEVDQDRDGNFWLGAAERVIKWDRIKDVSTFYYFFNDAPQQSYEIRTLCIDKFDRVWAGSLGKGTLVLEPTTGNFSSVKMSQEMFEKHRVVMDVFSSTSGTIWVGTTSGLFTVDPSTLEAKFHTDSIWSVFRNKRVNCFREDKNGNLWIGTYAMGVFRYNKKENTLKRFSTTEGLASNLCFALFADKNNNIYAGTALGFSIITPDERLHTYTKANGFDYERADGMAEDEYGNIWISNVKQVVMFDPKKRTLRSFDSKLGLSPEGFRAGSFHTAANGEIFFGSRKGINHFFPKQLLIDPLPLNVYIKQADVPERTIHLLKDDKLGLKHEKNNIVFRFVAIDLQGSEKINYRYKLDGFDEKWQYGVDVREARYSMLPPGDYEFKVEASNDGTTWIPAKNSVHLEIIPPLWQRWWFITLMALVLTTSGLWLIRNRDRKLQKQKEQLETEQAISYFMSSMSEQQTEEDILLDVAKNCVGRLHYDRCSIYMKDKKSGTLSLKSTSSKNESERIESIAKPQIINTVAETAEPRILEAVHINGTRRKHCEITVPVIYDEKVLGVIHCEQARSSFFRSKHLSILTTIANLCANKIIRARAEKERKDAEIQLTSTQRKMTEVEMQALRAQMNPHFIFNCLNSINRYIVKSDQTTASLYLTKFAKLIRLILDNSNSKNIILTNELEALKLYIEMEALRFDKKFSYKISVENFSTDNVEVPPLIIQPYVENAIWHGLLHKEHNGHLDIRLRLENESVLECVIEDNGIGRQRAKELKSKTATSRKSLGMQLTENRLSLMNKHAELNASVEILDLQNGHGVSAGTKVILKIPI